MDTSTGQVRVTSKIAGIEGYTVIDTGANVDSLNRSFVTKHNLELRKIGRRIPIRSTVKRYYATRYEPIQADLFGSTLEIKSVLDIDLGSPELQMQLSDSLLRHFIFQFDYPRQRLRLLSRDALNMRKVKNVRSKSEDDSGLPLVKVRLNDEVNAWLILDTAMSGGILLDRKVVRRTSWLEEFTVTAGRVSSVGREGKTERFQLPTIKFGPYDLGGVEVVTQAHGEDWNLFETELQTGSHFRRKREADGIIGHQVLKHFVVSLDYRGGHVHIGTKADS